jgi:hypothetical protein
MPRYTQERRQAVVAKLLPTFCCAILWLSSDLS